MKPIRYGVVLILMITVINIKANDNDDEDLVVQLIKPNGKIKGHVLKSAKNIDYYAFQEIPFAQPPTGVNRFQDPKPAAGWEGVLETTQNTKRCIQQGRRPSNRAGIVVTEDCLYLNVYTPVKPNSTASLPVYVWIHGGAFRGGDGLFQDVNPLYFMDFDVIVVSMNYRVGALGFLTTDDEYLPGNLGLKDQQLAIQWTAQNIQLFGGDPKKITVGGESAGSFSSSYQLLTPKNKGLISGVIQQSGSALGQAGYIPYYRSFAFQLGKLLNSSFNSTESKDLRNVLLQASAEDIGIKQSEVVSDDAIDGVMTDLLWAPIIENKNNPNAFITSYMLEDFYTGNFNIVPSLIGFNSEESLAFLSETSAAEKIVRAKKYDEDPSHLIKPKINVTDRLEAGKELKKLYTNSTFEEDYGAFIRLTSSNVFVRSTLKQAEVCSKYAPVYVFEFAYSTTRSNIPGTEHAGHGANNIYYWRPQANLNETIRNQLLTLWTNFIKYQDPTPEIDEVITVKWPKVETGNIVYLNINETLEVRTNPNKYNEVRAILDKYIVSPYIVY